jgi:hypothetical protein
LEAYYQETAIKKIDFELQEASPEAPCSSGKRGVYKLTMLSFSIKLKEEILLMNISE